jgi:hypothetical protein
MRKVVIMDAYQYALERYFGRRSRHVIIPVGFFARLAQLRQKECKVECKGAIVKLIMNKDVYSSGERGFYYFEVTRTVDTLLEVTIKHNGNTTTVSPPKSPAWTQTDRFYFTAEEGKAISLEVDVKEVEQYVKIVSVQNWCGYLTCWPTPSIDPDNPTPLHYSNLHVSTWKLKVKFWVENVGSIQGLNIYPETNDEIRGRVSCGKTTIWNPQNNKEYMIDLKCWIRYKPGDSFAVRIYTHGWTKTLYSPWYYFKVVGWP